MTVTTMVAGTVSVAVGRGLNMVMCVMIGVVIGVAAVGFAGVAVGVVSGGIGVA